MNKLDEQTALSILFANTKRKKRKADLLTIARSCEYLVKLYGSQKEVAGRIGLSSEMIREFLTVLKLPREVQELVSQKKIDSIDIVREISAIKDSAKQIKAANVFVNYSSKDVRDIKRLVKKGVLSVADAKELVDEAKPKGLHIFVMDFDDETYQAIVERSKRLGVKPAELVRNIVEDWLKRKGKRIKKEK